MKRNNEDLQRLILFQETAEKGSVVFLQRFDMPEDFENKYKYISLENAREFFIVKTMIEIGKAGRCYKRWLENLSETGESTTNNYEEYCNYSTIAQEQSVWLRKLLECLSLLLSFSDTNQDIYYFHYILIGELEGFIRKKREQLDFFECITKTTDHTITLLRNNIEMLEKDLNLENCWYLKNKNSITKLKANNFLKATFKQIFKVAIEKAAMEERLLLGYSYERFYSETSESLHFNPMQYEYNDYKYAVESKLNLIGLLIMQIIYHSHTLMKVEPEGINKEMIASLKIPTDQNNYNFPSIEIGDFVLVDSKYLAEVVDKKSGKYSYFSYLVNFLVETIFESIRQDWVPAISVVLYRSRVEMLSKLKNILDSQEGLENLEFQDDILNKYLRQGIIRVWIDAARKITLTQSKPAKKGEKGIGHNYNQFKVLQEKNPGTAE